MYNKGTLKLQKTRQKAHCDHFSHIILKSDSYLLGITFQNSLLLVTSLLLNGHNVLFDCFRSLVVYLNVTEGQT